MINVDLTKEQFVADLSSPFVGSLITTRHTACRLKTSVGSYDSRDVWTQLPNLFSQFAFPKKALTSLSAILSDGNKRGVHCYKNQNLAIPDALLGVVPMLMAYHGDVLMPTSYSIGFIALKKRDDGFWSQTREGVERVTIKHLADAWLDGDNISAQSKLEAKDIQSVGLEGLNMLSFFCQNWRNKMERGTEDWQIVSYKDGFLFLYPLPSWLGIVTDILNSNVGLTLNGIAFSVTAEESGKISEEAVF